MGVASAGSTELRDPWAFDNDDVIRQSTLFVLPGNLGPEGFRDRSMTENSLLAKYLRSRHTWNSAADISAGEWPEFIEALMKMLKGNFLLVTKTHAKKPAIQLTAGEAEAKHEIALLLNRAGQIESDFYPYRYLTSEAHSWPSSDCKLGTDNKRVVGFVSQNRQVILR